MPLILPERSERSLERFVSVALNKQLSGKQKRRPEALCLNQSFAGAVKS
jgi:hypothetical protein